MPTKKPAKRKSGKKKSAILKKVNRRKKPIPNRKPTYFKEPSGSSSAQIHQGVGPAIARQSEIAPEILDDTGENGRES
jgi:hypothetical protein